MAVHKTYVPTFIRLLRRVSIYITRHQASMALVLNPTQQACVTAIASAITTCLTNVSVTPEEP